MNGQGTMQVISLLCAKHSGMIAVKRVKQRIILYSLQVLNDVVVRKALGPHPT